MAIEGLNSGSLLRRTLLHVGTLLLASVLFVGVLSFALVTTAKSLLPGAATEEEPAADDAAELEAAAAAAAPHAGTRPPGKTLTKPGKAPHPAAAKEEVDDEATR